VRFFGSSMKIAHIADVHLGYQAYNRVTSQGINRRQADVFKSFREAMSKIADISPDILIVAGDLFHVVRPSNLIIRQTYLEFLRFRENCSAKIVIIGGNHDSPRSADTGCILDLFDTIPDVHVVQSDSRVLRFPDLDTSVFCLPHRALGSLSETKVEPDGSSSYNILTVHGTVEGVGADFYDAGRPISHSQISLSEWDYVALGHYHVHTKIAENAYYSGATEFTSTNIWEEVGHPKGFIEAELGESLSVKFHEVATRDIVSLRSVDAKGLTAADIDTIIAERLAGIPGGYSEKVVRLVVENLDKAVIPDIDYRAIRRYRIEALHFDLVLRPARRSSQFESLSDEHTARSLEDEWRAFASVYQIPPGLDRERFVSIGLEYMKESD